MIGFNSEEVTQTATVHRFPPPRHPECLDTEGQPVAWAQKALAGSCTKAGSLELSGTLLNIKVSS